MQDGIGTLVVAGVGLIGGSFALSLRRAGKVGRVIGVGRSPENLARALELGVVDAVSDDLAAVAGEADMVLLATPVGQMGRLMAAMAPVLRPGTLVSDAGSTKSDVAALFRLHLPGHLACCIPGHPIAGSELSGAAAAQYRLYEKRNVVLTPLPENDPAVLSRLEALWTACGAVVHVMTPAQHDGVFASVSHLPHLLAMAYVNSVAEGPDAARRLAFAASGFRDFTRIAGSSPEMWRDIALVNRAAILDELARYQAALAHMREDLVSGDAEGLFAAFSAASRCRTDWQRRQECQPD